MFLVPVGVELFPCQPWLAPDDTDHLDLAFPVERCCGDQRVRIS